MPRLLPADLIKQIAINYLLQFYEQDNRFVQEWEEVKRPFASVIEQMGRVSILIDVEHLLSRNPPHDLIVWVSDLQKLRKYLQGILGTPDLSELEKSYDSLRDQLAPYILKLNNLADNWNLRASWAGDELIRRDIQRVMQDALNAAGAAALLELSDQQIQRLFNQGEGRLPPDSWPINIVSLYLAGGRRGFIDKFNKRLIEFEQELKASGAKEPPSALRTHAEWWFDHYVHNMKFSDIADRTIGPNNEAGRYPENIRKAVLKFSALADIEPIERA